MDRLTSRCLGFTFALFLLSVMTVTTAVAQPPLSSFRIIDVPGARHTSPRTINNRGMIVGNYLRDGDSTSTGFMQIGRFLTAIKHPASVFPTMRTAPIGINDRGEIVGSFHNLDFHNNAFLLSQGEFTTISISNAFQWQAEAINNKGKIVGYFEDFRFVAHGFLFDGGAVTIIDVPGSDLTAASGINNKEQIVGYFTVNTFDEHGFLLSEGVYTTIDVPNSSRTVPWGINNRGQIVGTYRLGAVDYGFLLHRGKFTTIDVSVPQERSNTVVTGINDYGQITGWYFDVVAEETRGFTADIREFLD